MQLLREALVSGICELLLVLTGLPATAFSNCRGVLPDFDLQSSTLQVSVGQTAVSAISADNVQLTVRLILTAKRDITVHRIAFSDLRFNDVPVYASPVHGRFTMLAATQLSRPMVLTIYYRDVDLKPLRDAISVGKAAVQGAAMVDIQLSALAKLKLFTSEARVPVHFRQEISIQFPGGSLSNTALVQVLDATSGPLRIARTTTDAALEWVSKWRQQIRRDYAPNIWLGIASFTISNGQHRQFTVECSGLAVRVSDRFVVVTKELLQPWKFDAAIAAGVRTGQLEVDSATYDLTLWPDARFLRETDRALGPARGMRLSRGQLAVSIVPADAMMKVFAPAGNKLLSFHLHRRATPANLALLELVNSSSATTLPRFAQASKIHSWDSVAIVRIQRDTRMRVREELLFATASRRGSGISLGNPVDSNTLGSAVIGPRGVIGIVQDETSVLPWQEVVRVLKLAPVTQNSGP